MEHFILSEKKTDSSAGWGGQVTIVTDPECRVGREHFILSEKKLISVATMWGGQVTL